MKEKLTLAELTLAIPGVASEDLGTLLNTGSYKYYKTMRNNITNGICPFCQIDTNLNKVLNENRHWRIWENPVAKKDPAIERHFVIPVIGHITDINLLPSEYGASLFEMIHWACAKFDIPGGAIIQRFGAVRRNAGSIRHIHANIKVPTGKLRYTETLAKDENDLDRKGPILVVMEKMYQLELGGNPNPFEALTPEEQALVADRM